MNRCKSMIHPSIHFLKRTHESYTDYTMRENVSPIQYVSRKQALSVTGN